MGQAKIRGPFEKRKAQAIAAGRIKKNKRQNTPPPQLEAMIPKPADAPILCTGIPAQYLEAVERLNQLAKDSGIAIIMPIVDERGLVGRY